MHSIFKLKAILFLFVMIYVSSSFANTPGFYNGLPIDAFNDSYPIPFSSEEPITVSKPERLIYAIWFLQVERVEYLIKNWDRYHVDVFSIDKDGKNALNIICSPLPSNFSYEKYRREFIKITEILLASGSYELDSKDSFGRTPLHNAVYYGRLDQARLISYYLDLREKARKKEINVHP